MVKGRLTGSGLMDTVLFPLFVYRSIQYNWLLLLYFVVSVYDSLSSGEPYQGDLQGLQGFWKEYYNNLLVVYNNRLYIYIIYLL